MAMLIRQTPCRAFCNGLCVAGVALQDVASGARVGTRDIRVSAGIQRGTPGGVVYASDTAGEPAEAVGTKDVLVGWMESATVLFVRPEFIDWSR